MAKGKPGKQNMQNIYVYQFGVVGKYNVKRDVVEFLSFSCHSNFMFYPHEETYKTGFFENIIRKRIYTMWWRNKKKCLIP